jgi:hypothetical protein
VLITTKVNSSGGTPDFYLGCISSYPKIFGFFSVLLTCNSKSNAFLPSRLAQPTTLVFRRPGTEYPEIFRVYLSPFSLVNRNHTPTYQVLMCALNLLYWGVTFFRSPSRCILCLNLELGFPDLHIIISFYMTLNNNSWWYIITVYNL